MEHKFDMKPHGENLEEYGRLCRERTNKSMIKNRQIQVNIHALLLVILHSILCYQWYCTSCFVVLRQRFFYFNKGDWQWPWSAYETHAWDGWLDFIYFQGISQTDDVNIFRLLYLYAGFACYYSFKILYMNSFNVSFAQFGKAIQPIIARL